jgi:hypothetical protein
MSRLKLTAANDTAPLMAESAGTNAIRQRFIDFDYFTALV